MEPRLLRKGVTRVKPRVHWTDTRTRCLITAARPRRQPHVGYAANGEIAHASQPDKGQGTREREKERESFGPRTTRTVVVTGCPRYIPSWLSLLCDGVCSPRGPCVCTRDFHEEACCASMGLACKGCSTCEHGSTTPSASRYVYYLRPLSDTLWLRCASSS